MLFGIIGGDRRQEELLALLRRDGYTAAACGVAGEMDWDAAVAAEVMILPLPLCKEGDTLNIEGPRRGAGALFRQFRRDQLILAGQVKPAQAALAAELDLKLVDYFRREELTVANAAATAEGTVQVILERLEQSLLGSRCLVLGFGRIGKLLCHRLTACQWLKVWLLRKNRMNHQEVPILEEYNFNLPSTAYHCGGLMAVYAAIQKAAMPDVNTGIVERYYASAIQMPALVIGQLSSRSNHHLEKMENKWLANQYQEKLRQVSVALGTSIPATLNLEQQSYFALGYYQMGAKLSQEKKERSAAGEKAAAEE